MMRSQAALLALLFVGAPAFPAEPAAAPKAVVEERVHDFGKVPPRDVLSYAFVIRNEGTAPLEIDKVTPDCKCTATEFDHTIAPGKAGKVTAALDTRVLSGAVTGHLAVHTNDPASPVIALETQVQVMPRLLAKPGFARWNMVQGEREGVIGQTLWSSDGTDFEVLRVDAPPFLVSTFRPAAETERQPDIAGKQWRVEIKLPTNAPVGPIEGAVQVVTDNAEQPVVRIPVSGFVRPVIHVTPPAGDFGDVTLDKDRTAIFHVQNFATEKISVVKAETTVKGTRLRVVPVEEGRSYKLELVLPADMPLGDFKGALRIQTDSPKAPVVEVPLSGKVSKPAAGNPSGG